MPDIELEYAVPSAEAADIVTLFYRFRADVPRFEDTERADHAQLRFRLSAGGTTYRMPDGSIQHAAPIHIIGPTTGAMKVSVDGPVHAFGCGITPAGWGALLGVDASGMINRVVDAHEVFGHSLLRQAENALATAPDIAAMAAIGEALLCDLARRRDSEVLAFVRHVDAWLADSVSPRIEDLVAVTGLSRRQVERKCNALYGAPPKLLARKYRALRAAVALVSDDASLDDVLERGFYDQSHLIREIKQFTGLTPRQIKAEPSVLARLTFAQRHALGGRVNPLISDT
ncbi:MAG TPA: AraC family transcriptional regulator [Sphingomonas sp.]|nr:AraC family transcriptional regulator [Sphingomonas sp.]